MMSSHSLRRSVSSLLIAALLALSIAPSMTFAGMVGTGDLITEQQTLMDREQLLEQLEREDIRGELERYGVNPDHATDRVAAMTDAEIRDLAQGLDGQPAGAGVGVTALLLIIVIILLLR